MNISLSKEAVWDDDAVARAIDCAEYWVKNLPFVKSLSGDWKFLLASNPSDTPPEFFDSSFQDSTWSTIPGNISALFIVINMTNPGSTDIIYSVF